MFIVISPAKRLDEKSKMFEDYTLPRHPDKTQVLISILKGFSPAELQELMHINQQLADLNIDRYHNFKKRHNKQNSLQAIFAFNGDVFLGLQAKTMTDESIRFAQDHLRILSGLYGVLRPLDLIQAYRLEMGTKVKTETANELYSFWGTLITSMIKSDMRKVNSDVLINLASNEYYKAIDTKKIKARIITPNFREDKDGELKFYPVFGKKARGLMSRYIIDNQISDPEDLKGFNYENYYYDERNSTEDEMMFIR